MKDEYLPKIHYHGSFQVVLVPQLPHKHVRPPFCYKKLLAQPAYHNWRQSAKRFKSWKGGIHTLRSLACSGQFLLLQLSHWKRMTKGSSVFYFGALFRYLFGETENGHENQSAQRVSDPVTSRISNKCYELDRSVHLYFMNHHSHWHHHHQTHRFLWQVTKTQPNA